jgi:hypothetical protein
MQRQARGKPNQESGEQRVYKVSTRIGIRIELYPYAYHFSFRLDPVPSLLILPRNMPSILRYLPIVLAAASNVNAAPATKSSAVNTTVCNGQTYVYEELAGYGYLPSDFRDRFGDSVSLGSSIALDKSTWSQKGNVYEGIIYALPGMPDITKIFTFLWPLYLFLIIIP